MRREAGAALFAEQLVDPAAPQWSAERLQVVNWGGFSGSHVIPLDARTTLLTGESGTGKSTLLDAYIALMMPSTTTFNRASNDSASGRPRGENQRNVLSYARGKIDTDRDGEVGRKRDKTLRGNDGAPVWSAVAMTWRNGDGRRVTAMRVYHAPAEVVRYGDMPQPRMILAESEPGAESGFDVAELYRFAPKTEPHRVTAQYPGLTFFATYEAFANALFTRLGIGRGGDARKALKLLSLIQGGLRITTVDVLYKDMVLEEPETFARVADAARNFQDLRDAYEAMKRSAEQQRVLRPVVELHDQLAAAEDRAALIDTYRVSSTDPVTPFRAWRLRTEQRLLDAAVTANRSERDEQAARRRAASDRRAELDERLDEVHEQQRRHGGERLAEARSALGRLQKDLAAAERQRRTFDDATRALGAVPRTADDFAGLRRRGKEFLDGVEEGRADLDRRIAQTAAEQASCAARLQERRAGADSLRGRTGLVPRHVHEHRVAVARQAGLRPDELPFVAELVDLREPYEDWRAAAELALGGFALTMLVPRERLADVRRVVDRMRFGRYRLRFEGVPLREPMPRRLDEATLPGRLEYREESPFAGWLVGRLVQRFGYTCVAGPGDLARVPLGLTIEGQTGEGHRGAQGGHDRDPVIGFSNAAQIARWETEIADLEGQLRDLGERLRATQADRTGLSSRENAYRYVRSVDWADLDVAAVRDRIAEQQHVIDECESGNDVLTGLLAQEVRLREERDAAHRDEVRADDAVTRLDRAHGELCTRQDAVGDLLWGTPGAPGLEGNPAATLTEAGVAHLDRALAEILPDTAPGAFDVRGFDHGVERLARRLQDQVGAERRQADLLAGQLHAVFEAFQAKWYSPNRGTDPTDSYQDYRDILDSLTAEKLAEQQENWARKVNEDSGQHLLLLYRSLDQAAQDIADRLEPVNEILHRLEFGPGRDRLTITTHHERTPEVRAFVRELRALSANVADTLEGAELDQRYRRIHKLLGRLVDLSTGSLTPEGRALVDVRRHVRIEAERWSVSGERLSVYEGLGEKSGGETQELVAFIVGAALRYRLGDADAPHPRYAPVFLDEGFVKADDKFVGRAVSAWQGFGFQLVISAPLDKAAGLEPYVDRMLLVTKSAAQYARVDGIEGLPAGLPR